MSESILESTKKVLGLGSDYTVFDVDVMMHINSTFSTLNQLGLGPEDGFSIDGEESTWADFIGDDPRLNSVKTYVYLKVRSVFDPPQSAHAINAMNEQIKEFEWRLNVYREGVEHG